MEVVSHVSRRRDNFIKICGVSLQGDRIYMKKLSSSGLTLKLKNREFFTTSVKYLGKIINPRQLIINDEQTKSLRLMKLRRTLKELQLFLGLFNLHRRLVHNY